MSLDLRSVAVQFAVGYVCTTFIVSEKFTNLTTCNERKKNSLLPQEIIIHITNTKKLFEG